MEIMDDLIIRLEGSYGLGSGVQMVPPFLDSETNLGWGDRPIVRYCWNGSSGANYDEKFVIAQV